MHDTTYSTRRVNRTLSIQYLQYVLLVAKNLTSTGQKYSGSKQLPLTLIMVQ